MSLEDRADRLEQILIDHDARIRRLEDLAIEQSGLNRDLVRLVGNIDDRLGRVELRLERIELLLEEFLRRGSNGQRP